MTTSSAAVRLSAEPLVPVEDLARDLNIVPETIIRWAKKGRRGRKLDAVRRDGQWFTSIAALERFQGKEAAA